jgi:hypothetical protein
MPKKHCASGGIFEGGWNAACKEVFEVAAGAAACQYAKAVMEDEEEKAERQ